MMKIHYILAILFISAMLQSCGDVDKQLFNDKDAFFAFEEESTTVLENDLRPVRIPVSLAKSVAKGEVSFVVDTAGIENPAIEGVDFIIKNSNNTIVFDGDNIENVEIELIDNEVKDGDKSFQIILTDNTVGAQIGLANNSKVKHNISISDNEHPLAALIGYDFIVYETPIHEDYDYYRYYVEMRSVSGRDDQLYVKGLMGVSQEIILQFDIDENTVTLLEDQVYTDVVDPYYSIYMDLTFFGWEYYLDEDGETAVKRFPTSVGTFDLENQEIIFDGGYLTQITSPSTHPWIGSAYYIYIMDYCRISKDGEEVAPNAKKQMKSVFYQTPSLKVTEVN